MSDTTLQNETLVFLKDLAGNNDREWFTTNKERYLAAKADAERMAGALIRETAAFDPPVAGLAPRNCLFRIYRDVRFSKDKSPYKTHLGLWLSPSGRNSGGPGYYLHIEPGASFLAGGYWMPPADHLKAIRQEIDYNGAELRRLMASASFRKYFGEFDRESALKTAPQGYPKDHPEIELLRLKSFTLSHSFEDSLLTGPSAARRIAGIWKELFPLNRFLRAAVGEEL